MVSVFEVNIRFVGGLLAAYALTGSIVLIETSQCSNSNRKGVAEVRGSRRRDEAAAGFQHQFGNPAGAGQPPDVCISYISACVMMLIVIACSGNGMNWGWTEGQCSILAEFGTLQLEFEYLSKVTGDAKFKSKVRRSDSGSLTRTSCIRT